VLEHCTSVLGLRDGMDIGEQTELVERGFWKVWSEHTARGLQEDLKRYMALRSMKREVKDIVFGYGPLEDLLRSPIISEIMVVDSNHIYIEKAGLLEKLGPSIRLRRGHAGDHRANRLASRAADRQVEPAGRRPPDRRQPGQRRHPPPWPSAARV